MKHFIFTLSGFAVLTVGLLEANDRINVWLCGRSTANSAYKMQRLYTNPCPDEIPIIGSSRALGSFMPSLISSKCFNYGEDGSLMGETLDHLRVLLERPGKGTIIVNLDPWGFCYLKNGHACDYSLVPGPDKGIWFRLTRFWGKFRKNLTDSINARKGVLKVVDQGAVILKTSRTPAEWQIIAKKIQSGTFCYDSAAKDVLCDVLARQGEKHIIWVVAPISPLWRKYFTGGASLRMFLDEMAHRPNTSVLSFWDNPEYTMSDFVDPSHLNIQGVRKFASHLAQHPIAP